ncbi:unnamed protein product [Mytilus coruscus]|uniref:B box-type domain-containing protein n=1 Tax=Mytilus coruscus TaxID=42192 RepID=A0A6J8BTP6_MYTCO|nr:unnamed protein product [Mytilus coruscus]
MASNWSVCGICDFRHVTKPSVVWCSDCDEGLCDDCKEHHNISKSSRDHDIVPIGEYQNLPTEVLQVAQSCRKHNQKYQIFCKKHDCPCCKKCIIEEHNECKDFVDIDDVIKNNRKNKLKNEIQLAREAINSHLDAIQKKLIEDLKLTIDKENKTIQQFLKSDEQNEKEVKEFQSTHLKIKQHASELQTFLTMKQMERDITAKEKFMQSINKRGSLSHSRFFCKIDTTLEKFASNVKRFGEVVIETIPSDVPYVRQKDKQAQLMIPVPAKSIDDLILTLVQSVNTHSKKVSGCTMLPDSRMVFTCYHPGYVTVVNYDGSKDFEIKSGNAFDVVYLDDDIIAVTSGVYSHNIKITDMKLKKVTKRMHVGSSNDGLALKDKHLIYCGRGKGLKKISLSDDSVSTIITSKLSERSYVITFNDRIIFTDPSTNTVTCASMQGQVKWIFKDEIILKYPLGISVDNDGNVYVIGRDSCNVVVISPDGQRHRQILSAMEGLHEPSVLHYDLVTNKLLISNSMNKAFLFNVTS